MLMLFFAITVTPVPDGSASAPAKQPDDPIICTTDPVGSEVGTHMRPQRHCMRKSDRDFIEQHNQETISRINNNGNDRGRFVPDPPRSTPR